jgi:hypothetical protein
LLGAVPDSFLAAVFGFLRFERFPLIEFLAIRQSTRIRPFK